MVMIKCLVFVRLLAIRASEEMCSSPSDYENWAREMNEKLSIDVERWSSAGYVAEYLSMTERELRQDVDTLERALKELDLS
jgi:uncharacterized lipoprotein YddW (UPF0748 family)